MNNIDKVRNICFDKSIEDKILVVVNNDSSDQEVINAVRVYSVEYNSCRDCGNDLDSFESGYMGMDSTCQDCIDTENEDDE